MLLAQQDTRPLFEFTVAPLLMDHGIPLAVMGIFVVFVALILIASVITLLPKILGVKAPAAPSPAATGSTPPIQEELPAETLAILAAAVEATMRSPHRIVRIRGLTNQEMDWTMEGRMQHHQSHNPRHL